MFQTTNQLLYIFSSPHLFVMPINNLWYYNHLYEAPFSSWLQLIRLPLTHICMVLPPQWCFLVYKTMKTVEIKGFPKMRVAPNPFYFRIFHYKPSVLGYPPIFKEKPYIYHKPKFLELCSRTQRFLCMGHHLLWLSPHFFFCEAISVFPRLGCCFSSFRGADLQLLLQLFAALSLAVPAAVLLLRADLCVLQRFFQLMLMLLFSLPGFRGFAQVLETKGKDAWKGLAAWRGRSIFRWHSAKHACQRQPRQLASWVKHPTNQLLIESQKNDSLHRIVLYIHMWLKKSACFFLIITSLYLENSWVYICMFTP